MGGDFSRAPCLCKNVKLSSCHHSVSRDGRGLETGKPKPQEGLGAVLARHMHDAHVLPALQLSWVWGEAQRKHLVPRRALALAG